MPTQVSPPCPGQRCEKCGEVAVLVNFIARFGDRPAYGIFDCSACKHFTWVAQGEAGS